jgi:hypothetical protein
MATQADPGNGPLDRTPLTGRLPIGPFRGPESYHLASGIRGASTPPEIPGAEKSFRASARHGSFLDSTPVTKPKGHVERVVTLVNQLLQLSSCQRR